MTGKPSRFPFPKGFQFREHEAAALRGLFERSFYDVPYPEEVLEALRHTRFRPRPAGDEEPAAAGSGESVEDELRAVTLCRGADGIGKTRIFHLLEQHARSRDVPVYEIYNHDVEGIPLKPFLHTVRRIAQDLEIGNALLEKHRHALERVLPEAYGGPAEQAIDIDEVVTDRVRVFDGLTQLLLEVATRKPLLILVHDLHWGDLATVELIRYIGRNVQLRHQLAQRAHRAAASREGGGLGPLDASELAEGPEIEGFEGEEWRVLTPRPVLPHVYGSWLDEGREAPGGPEWTVADAGATGEGFRPARLMILANYRALPSTEDYIQQAIDRLGEESYAWHGVLRPLDREEAGPYLEKATEGVRIDGQSLELSADAVDTVHEITEGFPSFQQELFRGLFLAGWGAPWTADTFRAWLADGREVPAAGQPPGEDGDGAAEGSPAPQEADPSSGAEEPQAAEAPLRHGILRRRLADLEEAEHRALEVLSLARRPVHPSLVARVLARAGGTETDGLDVAPTVALLAGLEDRGIVERAGTSATGEGDESPPFFLRLQDYTDVVEATIPAERRARLHHELAEELRAELEGDPAREGAYEVYWHHRRGTEPRRAVEFGRAAAERCVRSLALQKARRIYRELLELLDPEQGGETLAQRLEIHERIAQISAGLKDATAAEEACQRFHQEERGTLDPTVRVRVLLLEAELLGEADPARGLKVANKALRQLPEENAPEGARVYLAITRLRLRRQDWKRATNFALKGLAICQKLEGDLVEQAVFYQLAGRAFYKKSDYTHAIDNYQRALEEAERLGARRLLVAVLDELGRVYLERGEYFRSGRYLYNALEIRRREQDVVGLCSSYDQLALCYQRNGDYLRTIQNLNQSLHLKERVGDIEALNPTLGQLGDLYFRLGHYQRAIRYFRREMDNARALKAVDTDETVWLADSFVRLGRVYLELGEIRQAENLCKQAGILAGEFKLRSQEADALLLEGGLRAFHRDWTAAERCLRNATDAHAKLGHRRREACAILDLGEVKFAREQYDEALKLASRAQITADGIKAADLQVRALTLKGNIHRFLKGGNAEMVREHLDKALEIGQNLGDSAVLFQLFYSLAKFYHADRDFTEAANYYGKAESILKRIVEFLPEELSTRYLEDRRRKIFQEDLERFRKEAHSRPSPAEARERAVTGPELRERSAGLSDYKELLGRILRAQSSVQQLHFYERLLEEAAELVGADRGILLRVQRREYIPASFRGFGKAPTQHPEYAAAGQAAEEAIRRGRSFVIAAGDEEGPPGFPRPGALAGRTAMAVPLMTAERIFGGIYVDKPVALGRFGVREKTLLESFAEHAAVAFHNRRHLDVAIQEPLTGFYTPSYFIDRLKEAYRWYNLHGKVFSLAGFHLPVLETALNEGRDGLGDKLARDIGEVLPYGSAICWGNPVLYVLLDDTDFPAAGDVAERVTQRLRTILSDEVVHAVRTVDNHYRQGAEIYFEIRRELMPDDCDQKTLAELRQMLSRDITIKEAKQILERHIIERTLRKTGGNITHAAKRLGMHRPQLSNLIKKYDLKREIHEPAVESPPLRG